MTMDTAIHFEGIKYAFRQSKDGIVVSFVVHPHEVPAELSTSAIGSRYMVALVEIDDDEQTKPKKEPASWRDLPPASQAFLRCKDILFRKFLTEARGLKVTSEDAAAVAVRELCGVRSRSEISIDDQSRAIWHELDNEYEDWRRV